MYVNMLAWIKMSILLAIFSIIYYFNVIPDMKIPLICYFLTPATTITVGPGSSVNITATPTISQSVELWCSRSLASKKRYIKGNKVKATPGEVWTAPGRRLGFYTFATSHAGTYSCLVTNRNEVIITYTVVLGNFVYKTIYCSCPILYTPVSVFMIQLTTIGLYSEYILVICTYYKSKEWDLVYIIY